VFFQPSLFSGQGFAAMSEASQHWSTDRRHISQPASMLIWLDV
jgi:hypothetical protein